MSYAEGYESTGPVREPEIQELINALLTRSSKILEQTESLNQRFSKILPEKETGKPPSNTDEIKIRTTPIGKQLDEILSNLIGAGTKLTDFINSAEV